MNTRINGITAIVEPVMIKCHCDSASPDEKKDKPTGSVRSASDSITINGHRNAFQLPRNVKILKAASAGQTCGIAILKNIINSFMPSIRAAFNKSSGICSMNCLIKNTPKPVISPGKQDSPVRVGPSKIGTHHIPRNNKHFRRNHQCT